MPRPSWSAQVHDHAPALLLDALQGGLQLGAAVAAQGVEDVAVRSTRVDADEDVLASPISPWTRADVLDAVHGGAIAVAVNWPWRVGSWTSASRRRWVRGLPVVIGPRWR